MALKTDNRITVIILTYNETLHIRRAIESVQKLTNDIVIVDSFSKDDTCEIAKSLGARVLQNPFVHYAHQFQWAMNHGNIHTPWVMRMDADEYLTPELINEIRTRLDALQAETTGIILKRQVHFMGKWIRYGGYYPVKLLRIWRYGHARIEQRWMDEHMVLLQGQSIEFEHDIIDDNLNSLSWWTDKHNGYATREAIDLLDQKYHFGEVGMEPSRVMGTQQAQTKRWYKNQFYARLPLFFRAWLYFMFRYWFRLGFLDGQKGLIWHFLQGFWYRFLVDAKIMQIKWWAATEKKSIKQILIEKFGVKL